ncbi:hypothetical protein D9758_013768 [Tetrapyrgos nigripes]|uniref:Transposase family Tnp2 protein n=1 Tax=Tetrapyrgos nigripes TaxID=182062 RepID=A0A8H5D6H6_9AGAR|nr:hypothetical protein D9758_013768 [Tetrapyrgos nigripes]
MPPTRNKGTRKPQNNDRVLCNVCNKLMSRGHERQHRRQALSASLATAVTPVPPPSMPPAFMDNVELVELASDASVTSDSDAESGPCDVAGSLFSSSANDDIDFGADTHEGNANIELGEGAVHNSALPVVMDFGQLPIEDQWSRTTELYPSLWTPSGDLEHVESDPHEEELPLEDATEIGEDDDDYGDFGAVDWDQFHYGKDGRLSASEQAQAAYYTEYADIPCKLAAYDLAICRAFSYKLQSHTTDKNFAKLPYAFPSDPPLPKIDCIHSRIASLSGIEPEIYHICVNSCICYVGPHESRDSCPFCGKKRLHPDGKVRKTWPYIPIIPRLTVFAMNPGMAKAMQYRNNFIHGIGPGCSEPGIVKDVFDGKSYQELLQKRVVVGEETLSHCYFDDPRDVALGVSTDGFGPFKRRKQTCAPSEDRHYIPAVSMIMRMIGHNGYSPCRMCKITGVRVPDSGGTTLYVPLDRSTHPDVDGAPDDVVRTYDPQNLPLCTHDDMYAQAKHVEAAPSEAEANRRSRSTGIKGATILFNLHSLKFPDCFPYDFMHLIWENLVKNLIKLWTGEFKGMDAGAGDYELEKSVWAAIGGASAAAGSTIPSVYGPRLPDISKDRAYLSAEMISFWTLYLGPVLLYRKFTNQHYYEHFVRLVRLLNICLQFEITEEEIDEVENGFAVWVKEYEELYYQHDPQRLSMCPLTVHALLHIAPSIRACGPVWCYWAFPMERYCGIIQPAIRSRHFPYASLGRYILEDARLTQIKVLYDVADELSLIHSRTGPPRGSYKPVSELYKSCQLLPPKEPEHPAANTLALLIGALVTRFDDENENHVTHGVVQRHLKDADVQVWGKVQRIDSEEGETMRASEVGNVRAEDHRDASYVRYEMYVDITHTSNVDLQFELATSYALNLLAPTEIIMAQIKSCKLDQNDRINSLDVHFYSSMGQTDVVDITCIQCLIGRVPLGRNRWAIVDKSGSLARALAELDDDDIDS